MGKRPLVSIVVPVYNAEKFLADTIGSVQAQTYDKWELILVDDCSTDKSERLIKQYQKDDKRIKLLSTKQNSGVAIARNTGVGAAKGQYLAFLDADDTWVADKLAKQLEFMMQNNHVFTFTAYEFADGEARPNGNVVHVPERMSRTDYLKDNLIWTSTVMVDMVSIESRHLLMPDLSYGEDALTWCVILGRVEYAYGLDEVTAYYRRSSLSLSSNKLKIAFKKLRLYWSIDDVHPILRLMYCSMSLAAATRKRL